MKTKIFLTALAFVAFTTVGFAGDANKSDCCKSKTECCKEKKADKAEKTAKTEKTAKEKK